uniref:Uncharacterized protein n=1 Tax=Avena sativa TaxID=4498 RepID=A0ACD5Y3B9_AVESA
MAGRRRRGRNNKLKRASTKSEILPGPTGVDHIPDHLLELVLLRVDSSLAIIRAAFTCKRWRRIVAATAFLTRFRSLHPAHVPGQYHVVDPSYRDKLRPDGNNQVFVPDPTTARAIDRRHFSLDFLPDVVDASAPWELADSRGHLLLLYRPRKNGYGQLRFPDLVVCDPLSRRYQGIAYPPEMRLQLCFGVFLLDGAAVDETGGCISMSNFRVMVAVYDSTSTLRTSVPVPRPGRACSPAATVDGGWGRASPASHSRSLAYSASRGARGGLCTGRWRRDGVVLSLDETTAEFSLVPFPDAVVGMTDELSTFWVVGGEDGAVRVVRMVGRDLVVFAQLQGSTEWVKETLVRLSEATSGLPGREETDFQQPAVIVAANAKYVLLTPRGETTWLFSVELDTREAERTHERNWYAGAAYKYELPWPPALQACRAADRRSRRSSR